jgi:putative transposase
VCRVIYNLSKEVSEISYKKGKPMSQYDVQNQIPELKQDFPWINEVNSQTIQLASALYFTSMKNFFKGAGYPKWASKKSWKSVPFSQGIKTTHNAFKLPKFGIVKVFKYSVPNGKIKGARLVQEADGIYLKIVVEKEQKIDEKLFVEVGIDMGIKYFLTTSDGEFVDNPKHLFKYLKQLRLENRKLSRMKVRGSNYKKQVIVLQKLYQKIKRIRLDFLHKETTKLASRYTTIIREDLSISKMVKGSKLAKHILDCSWGTFFLMLEYKTSVVKVNPAYTSQECSKCGHTCKENRKTQSLFECIKCGYTENADLNAAYNILQRGQSLMEANVVQ